MSTKLNDIFLTAHDMSVLCEAALQVPQLIKTDQLGLMALSERFNPETLKTELLIIAERFDGTEPGKLAKIALDSYDSPPKEPVKRAADKAWAAHHPHLSGAEQYYSSRIQQALKQGAKPLINTAAGGLKLDHPSDWKALERELKKLYRDGYFVGYKATQDKVLKRADATTTDYGTLVTNFDWSLWEPGSQIVADLLGEGGPGLQALLDQAGVTIKSIGDTTVDELSALLSQMAEQGSSVQTIGDAIEELTSSDRADLIATTELSRGVSAGTRDSYDANGIEQFQWMAAPGSCDDCVALEDGGPYDLSDEMPPLHPSCRCTTTAVGPLD